MASPVDQVKLIGDPYHGSHGASAPSNWESRNAYDLALPYGSPIYAVASGVIGDQIGSLGSKNPKFAGLRVHLLTQGNEFYYAHLSKLTVKAGQRVTAGQVIGYSGKANGVAHLHFAAKNGDPLQDLGGTEAAAPSAPVEAAPQTPPSASGAAELPNPYNQPPPVGGGIAQEGPVAPGSVQASGLMPRQVYENWQLVAGQQDASEETLAYLRNAQIAAGG